MRALALIAVLCPTLAGAETLVAARNIRAQTLITAQDVTLEEVEVAGALGDPQAAIGQEARVALYAGRPIRAGDVGPPALIERNQVITLVYEAGGLQIVTEGRSLERAGPDEAVRVMNLASRITVSGRVLPDGRVLVSN